MSVPFIYCFALKIQKKSHHFFGFTPLQHNFGILADSGGPAKTSAASATAPLPAGVRAADDFGFKGGSSDDSRRSYDDVGR